MNLQDLKKEKQTGVIEKFGKSIQSYFEENWKDYMDEIMKDSNLVQDIVKDILKENKTVFYYTKNGREIAKDITNRYNFTITIDKDNDTAEISFAPCWSNSKIKASEVFYISDYKEYSKYLLNESKKQKEEAYQLRLEALNSFKEEQEKALKEEETLANEALKRNLKTFDKYTIEDILRKERLEKAGLKPEDVNGLTEADVESIAENVLDSHEYEYH